jgi:hypothetical protein
VIVVLSFETPLKNDNPSPNNTTAPKAPSPWRKLPDMKLATVTSRKTSKNTPKTDSKPPPLLLSLEMKITSSRLASILHKKGD